MPPTHLVIDGSNIATEGRSLPSLRQLDEAVRAFVKERPHDTWTVVVDATFGHRIDASEKQMYEEALAANEMVTPPAGTIGRGDKFLLEIADRANATVFSNDSFQEFHGEYKWLFDPGRLIGGKPVPEVGWIFTERTPVRGPRSRMATRTSGERRGRSSPTDPPRRLSRSRSEPLAVPTQPPPRPLRRGSTSVPTVHAPTAEPVSVAAGSGAAPDVNERSPGAARPRRSSSSPEPVNEPLPFIEFIAEHGPGSVVEGEVLTFTSHGAFVQVGGVRCYLALKFMGDPAPRSARDVLDRGEVRSFVVQALDAPRRGIDLALPGFEDPQAFVGRTGESGSGAVAPAPKAGEVAAVASGRVGRERISARRSGVRRSSASTGTKSTIAAEDATTDRPADAESGAAPARSRRATPRRAAIVGEPTGDAPGDATREPLRAAGEAETDEAPPEAAAEKVTSEKAPAEKAPAKKAPAKRAPAKKAAEKAAAEKAAEKAPAKKAAEKTAAKKAPAKKAAEKPAAEKPAAKKAPAKKAAAKKAPAKKAAAEKAAAKKAPASPEVVPAAGDPAAEKAPAKKAPAPKAPAHKAPAKKVPVKKAAAKKTTAKKTTAKKTTANKATAEKTPARRPRSSAASKAMAAEPSSATSGEDGPASPTE